MLVIVCYIFAFLFGATIGSFLNVLIYRMPQDLSIIVPGSFCPHCKKHIRWYENIPIISFIMLRGKCSGCSSPISIHYPIVEALTGLLFVCLFARYGISFEFLFYILFFCGLIVISGIDLAHQLIPDLISIPGIVVGLTFQLINGSILSGLIGAAFGGGLMFLIRIVGGLIYKKEVMGLGDVYLAAMIGAFVGFPFIIPAIFVGALVGTILGAVYVISTHQHRDSPIPFGPFLSIGGILVILFRPTLVQILGILGIFIR